MDTSDGRRRRRRHSAEFKAKVVAASRQAGVSIAAVALANRLNANLLRRWVVTAEEGQSHRADPVDAAARTPAPLEVETRSFIPLQIERAAVAGRQDISIELRRGATLVKVAWPLSAAPECAACLRELLR